MSIAHPTESNVIDFSRSPEVFRNLPVAELVEHAIRNGEAVLASNGAVVSRTGKYTGRTPKDKYIVREPESEENIWWENNQPMEPHIFAKLREKVREHMATRKLYVVDAFGGTDPTYRIKVRVITEKAWHALFIKTLLVRPTQEELKDFAPDWTIVNACTLTADPEADGTRGEAAISLNFADRQVLIMGTQYAGEMKKSVFTILNYLLPLKGVLSMHCSANVGPDGDTALFFGLSGTGKTTLSADPSRRLIGDDEHGWTEDAVFNFEGGCYAKCIRLSKEGEPQIYDAIRFGSVLENVILDDLRNPDYNDDSITENTRCAYPVEYISNFVPGGRGGVPKNIAFLTCDAYGVLPPISKLTADQALYHFLNGYTAKVAGTEAGITEPTLTFSTCFGAPFLPLRPKVYADLLGQKLKEHDTQVWLINTGWTGGPFGVGSRMKLPFTRAMINAAFAGELDTAQFVTDPIFGLQIPTAVPNVPAEVLIPRNAWSNPEEYDVKANELKSRFEENFKRFA
jgi:phosphoenolpyruvate carboxykinase (ATP)